MDIQSLLDRDDAWRLLWTSKSAVSGTVADLAGCHLVVEAVAVVVPVTAFWMLRCCRVQVCEGTRPNTKSPRCMATRCVGAPDRPCGLFVVCTCCARCGVGRYLELFYNALQGVFDWSGLTSLTYVHAGGRVVLVVACGGSSGGQWQGVREPRVLIRVWPARLCDCT